MSSESRPDNSGQTPKKVVFVGDFVGKTSVIKSFIQNTFPSYGYSVYDIYDACVDINGSKVSLSVFDTPGQEDYSRILPILFSHTDVFIVCFSVVCPSSFTDVIHRWIPEIRQSCPTVPVLLVGNKADLLTDESTIKKLETERQKPVTAKEAKRLARRIGAQAYVECSALTRQGIRDVFETAARIAVCKHLATNKKSHIKCRII